MSKCMQSLNCSRELNREIQMGSTGSFSMNRKRPRPRPPRLEIPSILCDIRADMELEFSAPGVGVYAAKGKKTFMEDTHKIFSFPQAKKGFFGVYDGHGGSMAAKYVAEHLDTNINKMLENHSVNEVKEEAIRAGYLKTDQNFLKEGVSGGACCVTALIEGNQISVSNLGDCRAVLCRGGMAESLTSDHTAEDEAEQRRIQDQGGFVEMRGGAWRVQGILAVSRSIGDADLKDWVVAEPETKTFNLTPDMEFLVLASDGLWNEVNNQEAVNIVQRLCTKKWQAKLDENGNEVPCISPRLKKQKALKDPVNDVVTEVLQPIMSIRSPKFKVRRLSKIPLAKAKIESPQYHYKENADLVGLEGACKELVNLAVMRGSLDDITVIIVDLCQFKE